MTRWEITVTVPFALPSAANLREHWATRARRERQQRQWAGVALRTEGREFLRQWRVMAGNPRLKMHCLLTRVGARKLDSDNVARAFKAVRDEVAACVGIDDGNEGPDGFWQWEYAQQTATTACVRIRLEVVQHERRTL